MNKLSFCLCTVALALLVLTGCGGGGGSDNGGGGSPGPTLPATGMTLCSDSTGSGINCAHTGQDGEFITNPMSFTANGDGTVTDNVTGLMWQQADDNTPKDWATAVSYCTGTSLAGHSDWRLPTIREFTNIVDFGTFNPSIDSAAFPGVTNDAYWASTVDASNGSYAWYMTFDYGTPITGDKTNTSYALCVRGSAEPSPSFTDNNDQTITDNVTNLMWQKDDDNQPRTWQDALTYCNGLLHAGHDDWRLPNVKELASLIDQTASLQAINGAFPTPDDYYWTSTTYATATDMAWYVRFDYGFMNASMKTDNSIYVRCVR